jgi:hypothetical protein
LLTTGTPSGDLTSLDNPDAIETVKAHIMRRD